MQGKGSSSSVGDGEQWGVTDAAGLADMDDRQFEAWMRRKQVQGNVAGACWARGRGPGMQQCGHGWPAVLLGGACGVNQRVKTGIL